MFFRLSLGFGALCLAACSENNLAYVGDDAPALFVEPVADAGADVAGEVGEPVTLNASGSYDPYELELIAYQWALIASPSDSAAAPGLADTKKVTFTPDVAGTWEYQLTVQNEAELWDTTPDWVVVEVGAAPFPVADAGPDLTYEPLDVITLDGTGSYDPGGHEPLAYAWSVIATPANSSAFLDDPIDANPRFIADLAGDYVFRLSVTNSEGVADPTPDEVVITVAPADGFYVEASWPTTADIDLHLANSLASGIFDCPNDCNFDNPTPSWFAAGAADDPSLDEDTIPNLSGIGPEIITITAPSDDEYTVRVHYYGESGFASCLGGCEDTEVTVNVYLGGVLAATFVETLTDAGDSWTVATIEWPSGLISEAAQVGSTSKINCF
jgi:hypothetical protein